MDPLEVPVNETRMRDRMKGLFGAPTPVAEPMRDMDVNSDVHKQALDVLTLAERTATDHLENVRSKAGEIEAEARARAEQAIRDAGTRAEGIRRDADKVLAEARMVAADLVQDAQEHAEESRRVSEQTLAAARQQADEILR